ncbi:shikimate kinase [Melissococcus plutonius]|uniref:shikimate kinase n=1 Tax=Melissococcus plutonius TaxID=33970 RepID=UPI003C2E164B
MDTKCLLIGFMGVGKTTIAKLLAKELATSYIDLDEKIVETTKMPINDYFNVYGEKAFRNYETQMLQYYLGIKPIIATGGGIVTSSKNRQLLKTNCPIIYLKADTETLLKRITTDSLTLRPLIINKTEEEINELVEYRRSFYEELADLTIKTDEKTPNQITQKILANLKK